MPNPFGPLPYEWLGVLALAILWTNAILIAAAAMGQRSELGEIRARLLGAKRSGALVAGIVEEGRGPAGALAVRRVEQLGRAMTIGGPDRILFTDRVVSGESFGGSIRTDDGVRHEVEALAGDRVEIWVPDGAPGKRLESDFDAAWARASTNKGFPSRVEQTIGVGARVFVHRDGEILRIAALDPIGFVDGRRAMLVAFAVATILGAAAVTVLACWPPAFGTVSTVGAALGIAYFVGIQPLGTAVRDAAKLPPARPVGGIWQRP